MYKIIREETGRIYFHVSDHEKHDILKTYGTKEEAIKALHDHYEHIRIADEKLSPRVLKWDGEERFTAERHDANWDAVEAFYIEEV